MGWQPLFKTMDQNLFQQVQPEHPNDTPGLLLRLPCYAGLERKETEDLRWENIQPDALLLPDRSVPPEPELSQFLALWRERCEGFGNPYVVVCIRSRRHMSGPSISQMLRRTLESAGLTAITLRDLRQTYISRQLQNHPWQYALQITGLNVSTCYCVKNLNILGTQHCEALADTREDATPSAPLTPETGQVHLAVICPAEQLATAPMSQMGLPTRGLYGRRARCPIRSGATPSAQPTPPFSATGS